MEALGIRTYLTHETLEGDWVCKVYDSKNEIGEFCADAGLVSVFLLAEVLAYNPEFDYHTECPWTTTTIRNFRGEVEIVVKDSTVSVCGHGVNTETGEEINFVSRSLNSEDEE